jgi:DNA-binding transcriptional ArsR family regulator
VARDIHLRSILFHGFGDPSRLAILCELEHGPKRVTDLVVATGLGQSNVSKHLACLWDCGLVDREKRGREMHYRLIAGIAELLQTADRVLEATGERVRVCPRYGAARQEAA